MRDCCGPCVAATSCDTRLDTLMTDPPAAPALVLLATDTIELLDIRLLRLRNASRAGPCGAHPRDRLHLLNRPAQRPSLRQLLQQRENVLRDGIGLRHHRRARLLQDLRLREV